MSSSFNIYCDESCHLEHDRENTMVLGAVWHPKAETRRIAEAVRGLKQRYGFPPHFEVKWTKVSPAALPFYSALLDLFFDEPALHFRALIIPDKRLLHHGAFGHDHDTWYYKMYFDMLKVLFEPSAEYFIYVDIKDTRSGDKLAKLHDVLCHNMYDFRREILQRVQAVRSHEVEQIQLADLLLGAVAYANRYLTGSLAKTQLVEHVRRRSGYCLTRTTLLREQKVNLFCWTAKEIPE